MYTVKHNRVNANGKPVSGTNCRTNFANIDAAIRFAGVVNGTVVPPRGSKRGDFAAKLLKALSK